MSCSPPRGRQPYQYGYGGSGNHLGWPGYQGVGYGNYARPITIYRTESGVRQDEATIRRLQKENDELEKSVTKYKDQYDDAKVAFQSNLKMLAYLNEEMEDMKVSEKEREHKARKPDRDLIAQLTADRTRDAEKLGSQEAEIKEKNAEITMLQRFIFNTRKRPLGKISNPKDICVDNIIKTRPKAQLLPSSASGHDDTLTLFDTSLNDLQDSIRGNIKPHVASLLTKFIADTGLKRPLAQHRRPPAGPKAVPVILLDMERKLNDDPEYTINEFNMEFRQFVSEDILLWKGFTKETAKEITDQFWENLNQVLAWLAE